MFINEMKKTLNNEFNYSETENGALGYRTTGKELLDLNFQVASLRTSPENQIIDKFMKAFYENKLVAIKWLFYVRDAREGVGERRLFRIVVEYLCNHNPEIIKNLIQYIPFYGRFDDMWCIIGTQHTNEVVNIIKSQLDEDNKNMADNKSISLLAKWLPSVNTSSKETIKKAKQIAKLLEMNEQQYRKMLSKMRKYIDVVEVKMSAKMWDEIKYEAVPSRANLIYNDAFLRNDETRRREFLSSLEKGETKINASVLFPHDIVHKYGSSRYSLKNKDVALEEMWKALPNVIKGNENTIVVADGSGSMQTPVGGTQVTALTVANALAIYFAERSSGQFKDNYITFSERPQLVDFSKCTSLRDKIEVALRHSEVANTNVAAVFDLILTTAVKKNMEQSELPQNILIISDMEFDSCGGRNVNKRLFDVIGNKYAQYGYKLPRLIFWNVNSRTKTIPIIENDLGVALVSGFSVNIAKMVMSNKTDPYECLLEELMGERYEQIKI